MLQNLKTKGGVHVTFEQVPLIYQEATTPLIEKLNSQRGALFASNFEYPGRYTCWDIGFCNPPLVFIATNAKMYLEALNPRGEVLLAILLAHLRQSTVLSIRSANQARAFIQVPTRDKVFPEEERSKQPSVFTVIREILAFFKLRDEAYLGLYGAFGYDLIFQFEALHIVKERDPASTNLVLYFPDEITVVHHAKEEAFLRRYDFQYKSWSTSGLARDETQHPYEPKYKPSKTADHGLGAYAKLVSLAKEYFSRGDLFEVVPSQTFYAHCSENPSTLFNRMRLKNPSPYGFFINLGLGEYLIGASPEMYVRVQGRRVETCPISGTIARGRDALEDAKNIQILLDSEKECSELTMCTDVDRNDKSRICEPGTVRVIGRRQIELYSRVIHTVDHVEGILRPGFDAIDAFLSHMWVVTVTGAPKLWAMNFIEKYEQSPRRWYGGAVGWFGFDGQLNTGLVLRTFYLKEGIAEMRTGATLLYDSVPDQEEQETHLKAAAFLELLKPDACKKPLPAKAHLPGFKKKILLIDHEDSFVHTLANYFRQTGAMVHTIRYQHAIAALQQNHWDLAVLSPGPGQPKDFQLANTIAAARAKNIPLFGVCLGLQGLVEYYGGSLKVLDYPMHGKASKIIICQKNKLFANLDDSFIAARYHSLHACPDDFPKDLSITAKTEDGIIMAIAHKTQPIYAVQFHPEAILSLQDNVGFRIISNLVGMLRSG